MTITKIKESQITEAILSGKVSHSLSTAENDVLVGAPTPFGRWVSKTLAEFKAILGLGTAAYTASTAYDAAGTAAGKIASSISDGDTTHAPDGNSVFDALNLKAPSLLTGYTSGAGVVAGTDTVLQAIQKLNGNYVAGINTALPAFLAKVSAPVANVTGDNTTYFVIFDSEIFDQGGCFNDATGKFTAPVTGRYFLSAVLILGGLLAAHVYHNMRVLTSNGTYFGSSDTFAAAANPFIGNRVIFWSGIVDMDAGDQAYVTVVVNNSTKVVDVEGDATSRYSVFSGCLIC